MKRTADHVQPEPHVCRRSLEASVHRAFSERIYCRIRHSSPDRYTWNYLSTSPEWLMALGIRPGSEVLPGIHESDRQRTLQSLQGILSNQIHASRMRVRFCGEEGSHHYLRMNLVRSAEDENTIDGYLERDEPDESPLFHPWLGVLLERLEVSYTLIDRKFEIVDFNSRSNEYALAVLGQPLTIGQSILSYASEDSRPLLVADLEHAFSGKEVRREWSDETDTDVSTFSFMHIPLEDASGAPSLVAMCTLDLTKQRRVESRQRELAVAVAQSPISVVITDPEGTITYVNPFFEELSGYSAAEVLGKNPRMLRSDTAQPITDYAAMWMTLAAGKTWTGEFLNRKKNGDIYHERAVLVPLINHAQEVTSIVGLKEDITELTRTMNQLEEKEEHFRSLFDNAGAAIYIHDTSGVIREVNPMASMQTGYTTDELIGMHVGELDAGTGNEPPKEVVQLLEKNADERAHHVAFETTERRKDGTTFPAEVTLFLFSSRGEQLIAATVVDATERKQHLTRIQQSAEENAILLRELHHRVKNNLQSIASLLRLQLDLLRDPEDLALFEDNINRVLSMAMVHGMLDEATNLKDVDLRLYLNQLRNHLLDWSTTQNKRVSITVEGRPVVAGIEQAVPFSIIANELIMDAIQHSTDDSDPREIVVSLHRTGNRSKFIIRDNGAPGTGESIRHSGNGFATTLIHALAQQLGGTLRNLPGTDRHVELTFSPNGPSIGDAL